MSGPQTYRAVWRGIPLAITHTPNKWDMIEHIEVQADQSLPGTETDYKSLFVCHEDLAEYDGPAAFVLELRDFLTIEGDWTGQLALF